MHSRKIVSSMSLRLHCQYLLIDTSKSELQVRSVCGVGHNQPFRHRSLQLRGVKGSRVWRLPRYQSLDLLFVNSGGFRGKQTDIDVIRRRFSYRYVSSEGLPVTSCNWERRQGSWTRSNSSHWICFSCKPQTVTLRKATISETTMDHSVASASWNFIECVWVRACSSFMNCHTSLCMFSSKQTIMKRA